MGKKSNGPGVRAQLDLVRAAVARSDAASEVRCEDRPGLRTSDLRTSGLRTSGLRTLGPVSDLERHLPSEWWRTLFNSLYLETDGDIVENDRNTEQEADLLIRSAGL